jgi:tripartite-type tricarboxylate transporter receptor subunit TctC
MERLGLRRCAVAVALLAALACSSTAAAEAWPTKPIHVLNPWPPGGPADFIARPVFEKLGEVLGQPLVLDSKPGANGIIATAAVAKAAPDGHTLLLSHIGPMAISPALQANLAYDPVKDFAPITQFTSGPTLLVVRPELPVTTVPELIDYAKKNPAKLTYASVGQGSTTHLAGEMLRMMAAIDIVHVPYKGASPVLTDLLGGQVEMAFIGPSAAVPHIQSGKLRAIAVTTLKPASAFPSLPTVAATLPGFEMNTWYGLEAPAGTPTPIVERLQKEIAAILKRPEIAERLRGAGLEPEGTTPAEHALQIRDDVGRWRKLVRDAGVTAE